MKKLLIALVLSLMTVSVYAETAVGEACLTCVGKPATEFNKDSGHVVKHRIHAKRRAAAKR